MLFRKTFRNALATLLGTALALATGVAHAQINLDATGTAASPIGTVTFSAETLLSNATTDARGVTYYNIFPSSADFRVSARIGVTGPLNRQLFIRYDFGNMVARTQIAADWASIPDVNGAAAGVTPNNAFALEAGGAEGNDFIVFSVTAASGAEIASDAIVVATAHNRLALGQGAPGTLRMRVYVDLADALRGNDDSVTDTGAKPVANIARSLLRVAVPGSVTATVSSGFTRIAGQGSGTIGRLAMSLFGLDDDLFDDDAQPAHKSVQNGGDVDTLADVAREANAQLTSGSLVTFKGDFTVGRFYAATSATGACGTQPLVTKRNNKVLDEVSVGAGLGLTSLCFDVPTGNREEIPTGAYTVAVDYAKLTNAAVEPADLDETGLGVIRRDGTRVQIPYLTTYAGYTQRVVIVNRNRGAVSYTFSFVSEDGTVATAGDAATGSVPANSTMVLKTTDIVSLAGKTRTAATLDVVAPNGSVDIATTQVNMDDQGTDTVIYATAGS